MERMEHRGTHPACETCGLVPVIERLTGTTELIAESAAMQAVLRRVLNPIDFNSSSEGI